MGNRSGQSNAAGHHRTRSRMDEVVQAAANSNTQQQADSSPTRGKKRKSRHASSVVDTTPDDSESLLPPDQLSNEDLLNQILSSLSLPSREIAVANSHSNQRYSSAEQAFAKLSGQNWTYYLNETQIVIGRGDKENTVDVDLGPGKMVSRSHAQIAYEDEEWWLTVQGRNGLKADGLSVAMNEKITLSNGTVLEIGGIQMMFVLPSPLIRSTLLQIHARQHDLPLPFQTPSPAKRTNIFQRRSSSPSLSYPQGVRIVQGPRIITSPNGTEYSHQGEIDLSLESSKEIKPQYSYAMMIAQAILSVPERKMQLSKIYEFIMSRYSFYRYTKSGWQNSIRHNLSLNKAFVKVPRRTDEPGKGMKWQIAEDYLEEFVAKVHRTMSPRTNKKYPQQPQPIQPQPQMPNATSTTPDQQSPLRIQYPSSTTTTEGTPIRPLQIPHPNHEYMTSSPPSSASALPPHQTITESTTPERSAQRQFMPMSSPAPFYRYSSITTPASAVHDRSSPPSSGAIDLAETLVEFSSPIKLREPFTRRLSPPEDESPSSRPLRNGIKSSSLGDLQGVDLLRGFEKISSWREGSSPIKDHSEDLKSRDENGFGKELKRLNTPKEGVREGVNGNGIVGEDGCIDKNIISSEEVDSQMTDVKMERGDGGRK